MKESKSTYVFCEACSSLEVPSQVVVSRGSSLARVMLIGEAPGATEEKLGVPFVGRSGKFLDKLLKLAGFNYEKDIYITNVVKCRPPGNRRPFKNEIKENLPWLKQQIKLVEPSVILLAGATAVEALLGIKGGISSLRGTWQNWEGKLVMPLFHPAYLLRNPSKEDGSPISLTLSDLLKVRKKLYKFEYPTESLTASEIIRKNNL